MSEKNQSGKVDIANLRELFAEGLTGVEREELILELARLSPGGIAGALARVTSHSAADADAQHALVLSSRRWLHRVSRILTEPRIGERVEGWLLNRMNLPAGVALASAGSGLTLTRDVPEFAATLSVDVESSSSGYCEVVFRIMRPDHPHSPDRPDAVALSSGAGEHSFAGSAASHSADVRHAAGHIRVSLVDVDGTDLGTRPLAIGEPCRFRIPVERLRGVTVMLEASASTADDYIAAEFMLPLQLASSDET